MSLLKVIDLHGGPNSGKSVAAAELFVEMKKAGMSVELVSEYAKDMTWEKRFEMLKEQQYIFAKQHRRLSRLVGQVEWAVTDGSLLNSIVYGNPDDVEFNSLIRQRRDAFHNFNFFFPRNPTFKFHQAGRNQTEAEAQEIDATVQRVLPANTWRINIITGDYVGQIINALKLPIVRETDVLMRMVFELWKNHTSPVLMANELDALRTRVRKGLQDARGVSLAA